MGSWCGLIRVTLLQELIQVKIWCSCLLLGLKGMELRRATLVLRGEGLVDKWSLKGGEVSSVMPGADMLEEIAG